MTYCRTLFFNKDIKIKYLNKYQFDKDEDLPRGLGPTFYSHTDKKNDRDSYLRQRRLLLWSPTTDFSSRLNGVTESLKQKGFRGKVNPRCLPRRNR